MDIRKESKVRRRSVAKGKQLHRWSQQHHRRENSRNESNFSFPTQFLAIDDSEDCCLFDVMK